MKNENWHKFFEALHTWWSARPRYLPCDNCGRRVWINENLPPLHCSVECFEVAYEDYAYETLDNGGDSW